MPPPSVSPQSRVATFVTEKPIGATSSPCSVVWERLRIVTRPVVADVMPNEPPIVTGGAVSWEGT